MSPKEFYYSNSKERIKQVAKSAGTTFENFQQIALANGSVGKNLAARLAVASNGEMSVLEILYPKGDKAA